METLWIVLDVVLTVTLVLLVAWLGVSRPPNEECGWERCIYAGLPGWMRLNEGDHADLEGLAALAARVHYNGHLFVYRGSYWRGLLNWARS